MNVALKRESVLEQWRPEGRVVVVADDAEYRLRMTDHLERRGYACVANDGGSELDVFLEGAPMAVITRVHKREERAVCQRIRTLAPGSYRLVHSKQMMTAMQWVPFLADAVVGAEREVLRVLDEMRPEIARRYADRQALAFASELMRSVEVRGAEHYGVRSALRGGAWCRRLAVQLGLRESDVRNAELSGVLVDIGMHVHMGHVLTSTEPLSPEDQALVREHPKLGAEFVEDIPLLAGVRDVIMGHHERWDGAGYPLRKAQDDIPVIARIVAVVGTYEAVVRGRLYREPQGVLTARRIISEARGQQFDPRVVDAFMSIEPGDWLRTAEAPEER